MSFRNVLVKLFLVSGVALSLPPAALGSAEGTDVGIASSPPDSSGVRRQTLPYSMKGKVRLLFFWVEKDDVGGGSITYLSREAAASERTEGVEVLFGSIPERVPGGINRWGYAREWAYWETDSLAAKASLSGTVFEGFMRHSGERSLQEVKESESQRGVSEKRFQYDSSVSEVSRLWAGFEKRVFSRGVDFDYRRREPILKSFQEEQRLSPPAERRRLENQNGRYDSPYGFLTAVRETIRDLTTVLGTTPPNVALRAFTKTYVYNARPYSLEVSKIRFPKKPLVQPKASLGFGPDDFARVAQVDFRVRNLDEGGSHQFSIWFPIAGSLRGVPLRVVEKPRWWLQIELNLDLNALGEIRSKSTPEES